MQTAIKTAALVALTLGALAACFLIGDAGPREVRPADPVEGHTLGPGEWELDVGTFSGSRSGVAHPVQWTWVKDNGDGTLDQITVLYKPNDTSVGYLYPGSANPNLAITYDFTGDPPHADVDEFIQFVEDEYTENFPSLGVDQDTDFVVRSHAIETL